MNEHIMESLLFDLTLNALSPDVEQLLQAYLTDHPEFQPLSDSIHQTATLGQKAVGADMPTEIPSFPRERLVHEQRHVSWPSMRGWKAVAACILIGMGIGFALTQWQRVDRPPSATTVTARVPVEPEPLSSGQKVTQAFWSAKTYQERYKNYSANRKSKTDQSAYIKYGKRGLL